MATNIQKTERGYTLVEMLIYIAVLTFIFLVVVTIILSFTTSYRTLAAQRIVDRSATDALERMTREIRSARSIDTSNSTLATSPGILSLTSSATTTKFYIDGTTNKLDVSVNGTLEGPLTVTGVTITNLVFTKLTSTNSTAVKIDMTLQGTSGTATVTKTFHDTIVLRGS